MLGLPFIGSNRWRIGGNRGGLQDEPGFVLHDELLVHLLTNWGSPIP